MNSTFSGFLVGVVGLLCFSSAAFDWNWFIESRRVRLIVVLLGYTGARIFYSICGILCFILGSGMLLGWKQ